MKGIIVVDIPECCRECEMRTESGYCIPTHKDIFRYGLREEKPKWCPIINPSLFFHGMREATPEENEKINAYIESIAVPTGINIFDLLDKNDEVGE